MGEDNSVLLRRLEESPDTVGQVLKQTELLGDVVGLHKEFGLGWAERPFDGALPLHLGDEFALRPLCLGVCHNQRVFRVE